MEKLKSFASEAIIIGAFTLFSYFLFLASEEGYLGAFGIKGSGLIPLQIQSIVPSIIDTIILSGTYVCLALLGIYWSRRIVRGAGKTRLIIETALQCVFFLALIFPIETLFWYTSKFGFILYLVVPIVVPVASAFIRPSKRNAINKLMAKKFKNMGFGYRVGSAIIMIFFVAVFFLPAYAYCFGFIDARANRNFAELTNEGKDYLIVRQYNDRIILAQIERGYVLPNYSIKYISSQESLDFKMTNIRSLNFDKVAKYSDDITQGMFLAL